LAKKKKKAQKPQREFTRQQLSHWQQQKKRQRIIFTAGIIIIVVVIGIMGSGWYTSQYLPLRQTAIIVNGTEFSMKYYVDMIKVLGSNQSGQNLTYLVDGAVTTIEHNELFRQKAQELGFSISEDEVIRELKNNDLPDSDVYQDLVRIQLLTMLLLDEYFDTQVPVSAEQVHLMAMLLESEAQANDIRARLGNDESFAKLAREYSLDNFSKDSQGDFSWHPEIILKESLVAPVLAYAFNAKAGVLSPPIYDESIEKEVGYWLVRVLDRNIEEDETHIQIILLSSEEEAWQTRERLSTGEDYAALARELSQLKGVEENDGEFLVMPGMRSPVIDEFAFDLEIELETVSEPLRDEDALTKGGYWLAKVADKETDRPIADDDRNWLKTKALDEWIAALRDDPSNEIDDSHLNSEKKTWALEQATGIKF
jgi:hypothetical protein